MKKVLLATTALAFSAGWAMADVTNTGDGVGTSITLSGEAKLGIVGNDLDIGEPEFVTDEGEVIVIRNFTRRDSTAMFFTDIDLKFTMRGLTDGGLEFGAEIDIDENNAFDGYTQGGETLWLKGAFGNLTMGDTDGAYDWAMQESIIGGSLDDVAEHAGYSGNAGLDGLVYDGQIARYDYTFGDMGFGVAISAEIDDFDEGSPVLAVGAKYSFAASGFEAVVGGGVQWVDDIGEGRPFGQDNVGAMIYGLSGNMTFGAFRFIADYSQISYDNVFIEGDEVEDGSHWGVALGYDWNEWLFAVNYGHAENFIERDLSIDANNYLLGDSEGYALTVNYDLGGGAVVQGAISQNTRAVFEEIDIDPDYMRYSFGVAMAF